MNRNIHPSRTWIQIENKTLINLLVQKINAAAISLVQFHTHSFQCSKSCFPKQMQRKPLHKHSSAPNSSVKSHGVCSIFLFSCVSGSKCIARNLIWTKFPFRFWFIVRRRPQCSLPNPCISTEWVSASLHRPLSLSDFPLSFSCMESTKKGRQAKRSAVALVMPYAVSRTIGAQFRRGNESIARQIINE